MHVWEPHGSAAYVHWKADPSHIIGVIGFGIAPAIGFLILGAGLESPALLAVTVLIIGLAFGADGNITSYLLMRHFRFEIFSTVYSLVSVAIAISAASGALLASATIKASGGFGLFFLIASAVVLAGGLLVGLLGAISLLLLVIGHQQQRVEPGARA